MVTIHHMWLFEFKFKLIKMKNPVPNHTSHISSVQQPHVANGYHNGQSTYRTFPSLQKVLLCCTNAKFSVNHKYYHHAMLTSLTTFLRKEKFYSNF